VKYTPREDRVNIKAIQNDEKGMEKAYHSHLEIVPLGYPGG
jgi:hypothetical protein